MLTTPKRLTTMTNQQQKSVASDLATILCTEKLLKEEQEAGAGAKE